MDVGVNHQGPGVDRRDGESQLVQTVVLPSPSDQVVTATDLVSGGRSIRKLVRSIRKDSANARLDAAPGLRSGM